MRMQRLDNMARLPPAYCTKIFLQRDYSDGTAVRFQTKFPQELEGKVLVYLLFHTHTLYTFALYIHPSFCLY